MNPTHQFYPGDQRLLGVHKKENFHYFAIFIQTNKSVMLFIEYQQKTISFEMFKIDCIFNIKIENLPDYFIYYYKIDQSDKQIADPYARSLTSHHDFGINPNFNKSLKCEYYYSSLDQSKSHHLPTSEKKELFIYEMHIRAFTQDQSSNISNPGTFFAAQEKLEHIKELGFNAIEIMPIMEFNECELDSKNPITNEPLVNFWGYSTLNFFSIMKRYSKSKNPIEIENEFLEFVKKCHSLDIYVLLDVVYNHTGEFFHKTNFCSFFNLAPNEYYIMEGDSHTNYTGCGNTFNCNSEISINLIIDSLCYFTEKFNIDGFRFDLGSIFLRDHSGSILKESPIISAIQNNKKLINKILISEPWDAAGGYHVGSFPNPFLEWNGWFRDTIRQFFNLGNIYIYDLMQALTGSPRLYQRYKSPQASINFITSHDGFSLFDLVSYNQKNNNTNGEENRDGSNYNLSNNFGIEGLTDNSTINFLRKKQILNFYTSLFFSFGTPMFTMGDEYGHTKNGNNNSWCQDNKINYFQWNNQDPILLNACKELIALRKSLTFYNQTDYSFLKHIDFYDAEGNQPDTHSYGNFLGMSFYDEANKIHFYLALNSSINNFIIKLPKHKTSNSWRLYFDSYYAAANKKLNTSFLSEENPITAQTCWIALAKDLN